MRNTETEQFRTARLGWKVEGEEDTEIAMAGGLKKA